MSGTGRIATEDRLLNAAAKLFSAQGYAATSIRQICDKAEANIAAVNYHFGSKQKLYDAAIDHARASSNEDNPWVTLDTGRDFWAREEPETRLRNFISMMLEHALNSDGTPSDLARIMLHEMLDPTESFERQLEVSIRRVFSALRAVCHDVATQHGAASPRTEVINRVAFLVSAQCMYPGLAARVSDGLHPGVTFDERGKAALAGSITTGALALLREAVSTG